MFVEKQHTDLRMIFQSFSKVLCTFGANAALPVITKLIGDIQARQCPRALTKLDVSDNNFRADGGKALAAGIKGNEGITELNIASNILGEDSGYRSDMSGVTALANVIPGMGALLSEKILGISD
jgi:hypothetical protein